MRSIEPIAKLDLAFSLFCLQHRFCYPLVRLSQAISHTGDGHLYLILGMSAWWLDPYTGRLFFLVGLLAFSVQLPIYWLIKNLVKRRSPQELSDLAISFITPPGRYSLPSGHTAAAFLMASIITHFYPQLAVFAFIWASFIASSRFLLGVHFLTDVIFGALLGLACAEFTMTILL